MKRFLAFLLIVILLISMLPPVFAAANRFREGLYYVEVLKNNEVKIIAYLGRLPDEDVVIPETIAGKTVTEIATKAFADTYIRSVVIPATVKVIEKNAFTQHGDKNVPLLKPLEEVTILGDQVNITDCAFERCIMLKRVTCYGHITSLGKSAFSQCESLMEFSAPSIGTIGSRAFADCIALDSLIIPESITQIGSDAFNNVPLITVHPDSYAAKYAMENGVPHRLIKDTQNIKTYNAELPEPFSYTVDKKSKTITINGFADENAKQTVVDLVIPAQLDGLSVTKIGRKAFEECVALKSVTLPNSIVFIESTAFRSCTSLESVKLSQMLTSIGDGAFESCDKLSSIELPDSIISIGRDAFYDCSALTSINFPNSITYIGGNAFENCGLTEVSLPNNLTSIGISVFAYCDSLASVILPDTITSIGTCAFYDCKSLESISIPDSVTAIGEGAFARCGITSVTLPNNLTSFGNEVGKGGAWTPDLGVFEECKKLESVTFKRLVSIPTGTFKSCTKLLNITLPYNLVSIEDNAFLDCHKLASVVLPDSLTSIGTAAFKNCYKLNDVVIPSGVTSIAEYAFQFCPKLILNVIPNSYAEQYAKENNLAYELMLNYVPQSTPAPTATPVPTATPAPSSSSSENANNKENSLTTANTIEVSVKDSSAALRKSNGSVIKHMKKGTTFIITGYDPSCKMFTATYGELEGYVKGTGLSISKNELLEAFK